MYYIYGYFEFSQTFSLMFEPERTIVNRDLWKDGNSDVHTYMWKTRYVNDFSRRNSRGKMGSNSGKLIIHWHLTRRSSTRRITSLWLRSAKMKLFVSRYWIVIYRRIVRQGLGFFIRNSRDGTLLDQIVQIPIQLQMAEVCAASFVRHSPLTRSHTQSNDKYPNLSQIVWELNGAKVTDHTPKMDRR